MANENAPIRLYVRSVGKKPEKPLKKFISDSGGSFKRQWVTQFEIKKGGTLPYHLSGVTPQSTPFPLTNRLFIHSNFGLSTQARLHIAAIHALPAILNPGTKKPTWIALTSSKWAFWFLKKENKPGNDLLSHSLSLHYHRRYSVSLPGSEWDRVVPLRYGHQKPASR